ncbi:hypothetical protein [Mycolicibacterium hippocampi]|uniref:hypothetical protein n=1 Tax=Mycolicibacterium hippocampi TaxID=659824 RepID=UPI0035170590
MTQPQRFLAEWYVQECAENDLDRIVERLHAATTGCGACASVRLLATLAVPADEVVFGLFEATSAEVVIADCERVGLPPMRINAAVHADAGGGSRVPG